MTELGVTSQKSAFYNDCTPKKVNNNGKTDQNY